MRPVVALTFLMFVASSALATSFSSPERRDVWSPNGRFVLDVDPVSGTHTVHAARDRTRALWSFTVGRAWHEPLLLSNDGEVVARLHWAFVNGDDRAQGDCIEFWNADGKFKTQSCADACPDPIESAELGWDLMGGWVWLWDIRHEGDEFRVVTTGKRGRSYSMATGEQLATHRQWGFLRFRQTWLQPLNLVVFFSALAATALIVALVRAHRRDVRALGGR